MPMASGIALHKLPRRTLEIPHNLNDSSLLYHSQYVVELVNLIPLMICAVNIPHTESSFMNFHNALYLVV